ncbi:uncharacterized protein [Ptychodera flava]|uniref:uncharacterized protein n=1 Tax=Ptychodera flava TaxID=63121 RepID=UPI003969D94A
MTLMSPPGQLCRAVVVVDEYSNRGVFTEYVGCYTDRSARTLNWYFYTSDDAMNVEKCLSICSSQDLKAPYAGVQYGKQCFCGDTYDIYGQVDNDYAEYMGCYRDQSARALPEYKQTDDMTVRKCLKFCYDSGHTYAGVQYSKQCFCGSDYNKYGQKKAEDCASHCVGNDQQNCGGTWRNSVYRLPPTC